MIIWRSKTTVEDVAMIPSMGRRWWRWVLSLHPTGIFLDEEMRFLDRGWSRAARYVHVFVGRCWALGSKHDYYDGPHCAFSFGFLHVCWSLDWCTKCAGDGEP